MPAHGGHEADYTELGILAGMRRVRCETCGLELDLSTDSEDTDFELDYLTP